MSEEENVNMLIGQGSGGTEMILANLPKKLAIYTGGFNADIVSSGLFQHSYHSRHSTDEICNHCDNWIPFQLLDFHQERCSALDQKDKKAVDPSNV